MSFRVVLDTNVCISGLLFGGVPGAIVDAAAEKRFGSVTSQNILVELEEKLAGKLEKTPDEISVLLGVISRVSEIVQPTELLNVCRDSEDNHVLECAIAGQANVIVTGDKDLLVLHPFRGIRILTPRQLLDELQPTTP